MRSITNPLVSIVIPVYKPNPHYIAKVVESISIQDYPNLEIIFSDDEGGFDQLMTNNFQKFYHREDVKVVINQGTRGIFSNLNNAIKHAKGEFVQLFSQDDIMLSSFISNQIAPLITYFNVGMSFCPYKVIDDSGQELSKGINYTFRRSGDEIITSENATVLFLNYGCLPGNISPVMLRKEAIEHVGLFSEELPYAGDFDYWVRISKNFDLYYQNKLGLLVRKHNLQASQTIPNIQLLKDLTLIYSKLIESLPKHSQRKETINVNRRVGAAFIHDMLVSFLKGRVDLKDIRDRFRGLKNDPFNRVWSLCFYIYSIPKRILIKFGVIGS